MSIDTNISDDGHTLTISISGRFDFSKHKDFRSAYRGIDPGITYRLNLSDTEYMDSSALGMLLLLKKHADYFKGRVVIENAQDDVKKILAIANFDKLFNIE